MENEPNKQLIDQSDQPDLFNAIATVKKSIEAPFIILKNTELGPESRVFFDGNAEPSCLGADGKVQRLGYPVLSQFRTEYPPIITIALIELYQEYRKAFLPLIERNREHDTDYQYCFDNEGTPIIFGVQIDMQPLPKEFLEKCRGGRFDKKYIKEALRGIVFELEGSMAMTPLLEIMFQGQNNVSSDFKLANRKMLDAIKNKHSKPVVMLAVTTAKRDAILTSEFGSGEQTKVSPSEILNKSGFDDVWGPDEFIAYLAENSEENLPLFYVRASDPVAKLKDPNATVEHPLLGNDEYRRIIKKHALTLNINNPNDLDPSIGINDTKAYMEAMSLAHSVESPADIFNNQYLGYLDLLSQKKDLNKILSEIKTAEMSQHSTNPGFRYLATENKVISKRVGLRLDSAQIRVDKLVARKDYNNDKINALKQELGARFDEKKELINTTMSNLDQALNVLETKLGIKNKSPKNPSNDKLTSLIQSLKTNLVQLGLEKVNFDNFNTPNNSDTSPFTSKFLDFLKSRGATMENLKNGQVRFRGKPLRDAYGCYGHLPKSNILDPTFVDTLQSEINQRGPYVFQIEMRQCLIQDSTAVFDSNGKLASKFLHFLESRQITADMITSCLQKFERVNPSPTQKDILDLLVSTFPNIKNEFWFDALDTQNPVCALKYVTIDRNFLLPDISGDQIEVIPAGGFRSMIVASHSEAKSGRIHGNDATRWAPITMQTC